MSMLLPLALFFRMAIAILIFSFPMSFAVAKNPLIVEALLRPSAESNELLARQNVERLVKQLFVDEDFDSLEIVAGAYRDEKLKTNSGVFKLTIFYSSLVSLFSDALQQDRGLPELSHIISNWLLQFPHSTTAHLTRAKSNLVRAWRVRGSGFADTVKPENWPVFFDILKQTRQYMIDNAKDNVGDPEWDLSLLVMSRFLNDSEEKYNEIAELALENHPDYYQLYFEISVHYLPNWGGSSNALEDFAKKAVERTKDVDGYGVYARIYWYAADTFYGPSLYKHSSIDWSEMKLGIDDVLKKFPDKWNIYNFGMIACFAKDQELAAELFRRLHDSNIPSNWPGVKYFGGCRNYAGLI
jgi:Domain of unknown function (DUF4034)